MQLLDGTQFFSLFELSTFLSYPQAAGTSLVLESTSKDTSTTSTYVRPCLCGFEGCLDEKSCDKSEKSCDEKREKLR